VRGGGEVERRLAQGMEAGTRTLPVGVPAGSPFWTENTKRMGSAVDAHSALAFSLDGRGASGVGRLPVGE